jgi:4-nitrophenol 2-monooxygenase / 4-nitrocatechol 4-monooxygenase, reductase component
MSPSPIDAGVFRDVIGHFASGVTIVTTRVEGRDFGTTASAVSSLSMEPPMLLACLNRSSETGRAIVASRAFAVSILGEGQGELATRFATKSPAKFRDGDLARGEDGIPLIAGALAHLECNVVDTATGGTHTVFLAQVHAAAAGQGSPLTYYRGRFGRWLGAEL